MGYILKHIKQVLDTKFCLQLFKVNYFINIINYYGH